MYMSPLGQREAPMWGCDTGRKVQAPQMTLPYAQAMVTCFAWYTRHVVGSGPEVAAL